MILISQKIVSNTVDITKVEFVKVAIHKSVVNVLGQKEMEKLKNIIKNYLEVLALIISFLVVCYLILAFVFWDIGFLPLSPATIRGGIVIIVIVLLILWVGHPFDNELYL